jgi:hypothetical protein
MRPERIEPILDRLDRAAARLNPLLILVALMLGLLDVSCWSAQHLARVQPTPREFGQTDPGDVASPTPAHASAAFPWDGRKPASGPGRIDPRAAALALTFRNSRDRPKGCRKSGA